MKLILSSCDFINDNSRKVINDNVDVTNSKVLFIPNEKATKELINSDKYYKRLYKDGFTENNIYIFDEENANQFINLDIDVIYVGGGNTFATLKKIKDCGFVKYIINYINMLMKKDCYTQCTFYIAHRNLSSNYQRELCTRRSCDIR